MTSTRPASPAGRGGAPQVQVAAGVTVTVTVPGPGGRRGRSESDLDDAMMFRVRGSGSKSGPHGGT